jgi:hypothetical protein
MKQKIVKNGTNHIQSPEPILRIITIHVSPRKWYGCIYYSSNDMTGQLIILLKEMTGEYNGKFLKHQICILKATKKIGVDIKVNEKLQSLVKSN